MASPVTTQGIPLVDTQGIPLVDMLQGVPLVDMYQLMSTGTINQKYWNHQVKLSDMPRDIGKHYFAKYQLPSVTSFTMVLGADVSLVNKYNYHRNNVDPVVPIMVQYGVVNWHVFQPSSVKFSRGDVLGLIDVPKYDGQLRLFDWAMLSGDLELIRGFKMPVSDWIIDLMCQLGQVETIDWLIQNNRVTDKAKYVYMCYHPEYNLARRWNVNMYSLIIFPGMEKNMTLFEYGIVHERLDIVKLCLHFVPVNRCPKMIKQKALECMNFEIIQLLDLESDLTAEQLNGLLSELDMDAKKLIFDKHPRWIHNTNCLQTMSVLANHGFNMNYRLPVKTVTEFEKFVYLYSHYLCEANQTGGESLMCCLLQGVEDEFLVNFKVDVNRYITTPCQMWPCLKPLQLAQTPAQVEQLVKMGANIVSLNGATEVLFEGGFDGLCQLVQDLLSVDPPLPPPNSPAVMPVDVPSDDTQNGSSDDDWEQIS